MAIFLTPDTLQEAKTWNTENSETSK